jgi:hypothetical protein
VTGRVADPLTAVCLDAWLLASHGAEGDGVPEGRAWEAAVAELLAQPGMSRRQGPGGTTLLGLPSASGCRHELDGAAAGWPGLLITECKARTNGIMKADIATFESKTFDFYTGNLDRAAGDHWWRILVSATPVAEGLRRMCFCGATILVEPGRLPLPVLLWTAAAVNADIVLPELLLAEALRLGGRAQAPMQARWTPDGSGSLRYDTTWWTATALDDLIYVQDELSGALLDLYDRHGGHYLEHRAAALRDQLRRR